MKRRSAVFFLLSAVISLLFAGCSSEPITLNIKVTVYRLENAMDEEIVDTFTLMEKASEDFKQMYGEDITFNITQIETGKDDHEIVHSFGTDNAADILLCPNYLGLSYVNTGMVVPVDDIITEQTRDDILDLFWRDYMVDGKTYFVPYFAMQNVLAYNKELFREAGLEEFITDEDIVQNWTSEEWGYILSELNKNLPPTVYPMMMYGSGNNDSYIMALLYSRGCAFFDENGNVHTNTPEGIAALNWLRACDKEGCFPPSAEFLDKLDNYDLFMNDQLAIYYGSVGLQSFYDEKGMDCGYVNIPTKDGKGCCIGSLMGFEIFDNDSPEKLAAAKAFVQYIYQSDWLDYSAAAIPVSSSVAKKYSDELTDIQKYVKNADKSIRFTNGNILLIEDAFYSHIRELLSSDKSTELIAAELDADCNAIIAYGYGIDTIHK